MRVSDDLTMHEALTDPMILSVAGAYGVSEKQFRSLMIKAAMTLPSATATNRGGNAVMRDQTASPRFCCA